MDNKLREPVERIMGKISRIFQATIQEKLAKLDIDRSFYPLLLIEAGNGITQQELSKKLSCDKVQVVRIIDYLSSHGYVERIQNKTDRRKYELTITQKAKQILPEIKKTILETSSMSLKGLSVKQINELYRTLSIIESNLLSHKKLM